MAALSAIERSLPPGDRAEAAEIRPDFFLGLAFDAGAIDDALDPLVAKHLRFVEALAGRQLSIVLDAAREMKRAADRVAALCAAVEVKAAAEAQRKPRARS